MLPSFISPTSAVTKTHKQPWSEVTHRCVSPRLHYEVGEEVALHPSPPTASPKRPSRLVSLPLFTTEMSASQCEPARRRTQPPARLFMQSFIRQRRRSSIIHSPAVPQLNHSFASGATAARPRTATSVQGRWPHAAPLSPTDRRE